MLVPSVPDLFLDLMVVCSLIRSELLVESLKRLKHAVHDEWLVTFLMTRIKKL